MHIMLYIVDDRRDPGQLFYKIMKTFIKFESVLAPLATNLP